LVKDNSDTLRIIDYEDRGFGVASGYGNTHTHVSTYVRQHIDFIRQAIESDFIYKIDRYDIKSSILYCVDLDDNEGIISIRDSMLSTQLKEFFVDYIDIVNNFGI
jgi:hypothetical protein